MTALSRWFTSTPSARRTPRPARRPSAGAPFRPALLALEDRVTPATQFDITGLNSTAVVNGAVFQQLLEQPTGTGRYHSFVRLDSPGNAATEQGYNTSARPLNPAGPERNDANASRQFTRDLLLSTVPVVTRDGTDYYEFKLDTNEPNNAGNTLISLDRVEIYLAAGGGLRPGHAGAPGAGTLGSGFTKVYDLDAGGDNYVLLDDTNSNGSGQGDMALYVPKALFDAAAGAGEFVYFFSRFGDNGGSVGGFEEWGVNQTLVAPPDSFSISGVKFEDQNGDGTRDPGDQGLAGWTIYVDENGNGTHQPGEPFAVTAADGSYTIDGLAAGVYTLREVLVAGWTQTAPGGDGAVTVTVGPDAAGADFGNFQNVTITGRKFYDNDPNGEADNAADPGIRGWVIAYTYAGPTAGTGTVTTGPGGTYTIGDLDGDGFSDLGPGYTVTVTEVQGANWIQTYGIGGYTVVVGGAGLPSGAASTDNDFGNVRLGAGGGLTLGFWSNKNGQAAQFGTPAKAADTLAFLRGLNLRNADGSDFDPTCYAQFRSWLLGATATNMAYMLSAQLAAMELNVRSSNVSGGALVWNGTAFVTVNALMAAADAELGLHGLTTQAGDDRAYQEMLKNTLDAANNNKNFVQTYWLELAVVYDPITGKYTIV